MWIILFLFCTIFTIFIANKFLKNSNERILFLITITSLVFSAPFVWWIISEKSLIGFIRYENMDAWIGFYGSIIGGVLTLFGVWWTIADQEKKRREELAIQYQPILSANLIELKEKDKLCSELTLLFNHDGFSDNDLELAPYMIELTNLGRGEIRNTTIKIYESYVVHEPFTDDNKLNLSRSYILLNNLFDFIPINGKKYLLIMIPKQKVTYDFSNLIRICVTLKISINGFIIEKTYDYLLNFYINIHINSEENRITVDSLTLSYNETNSL